MKPIISRYVPEIGTIISTADEIESTVEEIMNEREKSKMATKDELSLARIFRALWEHAEKDREKLRATLKDLNDGGRLGLDTHDLITRVLEETDV